MQFLTNEYIRTSIADSYVIFKRGLNIFQHGSFLCINADWEKKSFRYEVDGNYGDYIISINIKGMKVSTSCSCPYPGSGCKHIVAILMDIGNKSDFYRKQASFEKDFDEKPSNYLNIDEIKAQVIKDRRKRAKSDNLILTQGEMFKGEHLVENQKGVQYMVTLHDPENEKGHCSCPDFLTNRLNICKHLIFAAESLKKDKRFYKRIKNEKFPFIDIYWDSITQNPKLFYETKKELSGNLFAMLSNLFTSRGEFAGKNFSDIIPLIKEADGDKSIRVSPEVIKNLDDFLIEKEILKFKKNHTIDFTAVKKELYPYQKEGVKFGLYKKAALIGDEMGLGKTLQAIVIASLKKELFGFDKVLIITLASLKEQWKREIKKFINETAIIIEGSAQARQDIYEKDASFFKITNYEAVLRDITVIFRFKPDIVILDEAQRIKNFNTKTAEAVKSVPRKHAMVLTGTPLENKLEDVYSIVQFLDPMLLSPLWKFAGNHFMLSRNKKGQILGYRNLDVLHNTLKSLVIRRKKEEVLSDLPETVQNNYYLDLTDKQSKIHAGYIQALMPLLNKKFLTPMDVRRIQTLLLKARQVCDSTFLIDRKTNISPKLKELSSIINELVVQNNRKVIIFTEWTTMIYLIAKQLSNAEIPFVELSGKIPVKKRQALIDEFTNNKDCKVFLSSDAGGTGLNLQAADCVINFELPWNPAKLNQRIGRVNRIGQKSRCINVVNLISKSSIEERIFAGIQLKMDLFKGVLEGGEDEIEFSAEKKNAMLNRLREMMGEEAIIDSPTRTPSKEIPEDTPYYLNPEVMDREKNIDYEKEEAENSETDKDKKDEKINIFENHSSEKIETVLNSGMSFISGLMEMATGKKVEIAENDNKMIKIDKDTGEVTMKFKLPGF
jgi:SNF2 family DNA or RNA helicase